MTRSLVILGFLASGCVVLPTTKTTTRNAGTEQSAVTHGRIKSVALRTASSRTDVSVHATHQRECHRQVFAVTEVTKGKAARFGVDDPRGRVLGIFVAPLTIPISAIITGLVVASSDDEVSRVTTPLRTETTSCTTDAANVALELQFPSGNIYRGKTDAKGALVAEIPPDEPYVGNVVVRGAETSTEVHYEQMVPPVTAARDAVESCHAGREVIGVRLELAIDDRGLVTRVGVSPDDPAFDACVRQRIADVIFPRTMRNTTVVLPFAPPTS
jgi:hypothetical protein